MGGATTETHALSIEQQRYLRQIWGNITLALVVTGHGTDLCEALKAACTQVRDHPSSEKNVTAIFADVTGRLELDHFTTPTILGAPYINQHSAELGWDTDLSAGGGRFRTTIDDYTTDIDTRIASDSKSDDYDMDDFFNVSGDLIAESADLSQHRMSQTSSEVLNLEDPSPALHISPTDNTADACSLPAVADHSKGTRRMSLISQPACQPFDKTAGRYAAGHHLAIDDTSLVETRPSQSTYTLPDATCQKLRRDRKNVSVRISVKADLTAAEIGLVSKILLVDNALSFFLSHSQYISVARISSVQATTSVGVVHSIVAAFDEVHRLAKDSQGTRLSLWFSYIQLKYAIDALNATATKLRGLVQRKRGYSNASLAIDIYLNAKKNASDEILSRDDLSEYRRVSMRWSQPVRASPLQFSVYSDIAETIMYVAPVPGIADTKYLKAATTQSSHLACRRLLIWSRITVLS